MSKITKTVIAAAAALVMLAASGCASVPANTVFKADDLFGKKIGVQLGTTGDDFVRDEYTNEKKEDADKLENPATIERYNKGNDAILALKQGKLDAVVIDIEPAKAFVAKNSDLKLLDKPLTTEDYAACFKKNNALKDTFNTALKTLTDNGTITKIIGNYIGDEKGGYQYATPAGTTYPNGKLTMYTNAYFEPYEYYADGKVVGIDADIAKAICDIMGYELVIEDVEFNSIIAAVSTKDDAFGMAGMTVKPERLESVDFSSTYTTAAQVIVVRAK